MKQRKGKVVSLLVIASILLNIAGKTLTTVCSLPVWLDSVGTTITAYILGPVCGMMVGLAGNIIWGFFRPVAFVYGATSIAIGVIIGVAAKRGMFERLFGTMSVSVLVTLASVVISTPFNLLFYSGKTGNIWGDGVREYLLERELPPLFCAVAGEFYIDFLDKVLTLLMLYLLIKLYRFIRKKQWKNHPGTAGLLLFLIITGTALAQTETVWANTNLTEEAEVDYNTYIQTVYSSENGLPCGEANDIAQTKNGILWIGTYAGLYRYNGSEFRWMNEYESIHNVNCMFVDEEGRLWIGTNDNGVSILINEKIVNVIDKQSGLPSDSVRCITESADGDYYIGTSGSMQVLTLNGGLKTLNTISSINYAASISSDKEGRIATVTSNGELFLLKNREIQYQETLNLDQEIYTTCVFQENLLYVGTSNNHIYVFDVSGEKPVPMKVLECGELSNINRIQLEENGSMLVCTDSGVGTFDQNGNFETINTGSFNNSIDSVAVDYQGNLWFTSSRMGLLRLCHSAFTDVYSQNGMEPRVVNTVSKWQNKMYFGTDTGLDIVDLQTDRQIDNALTKRLKNIRIRCIRVDSNDHLWICTYGKGLLEVTPDGKVSGYDSLNGAFGDRARVVLELSDGTIAAAGDTGVSLIQNQTIMKTLRYGEGLSNAMILTLSELEEGTLLAGTDGDGVVVIRDGAVSRTLTKADGLSSDIILRTVKDQDGTGVFLVTSNGLCYLEKDLSIRTLNQFPYFNNYDLWQDQKGHLFVTGSEGVYVVSRSELLSGKENLDYELLNAHNGLTGALTANSWNYCDENQNLFLACDSGVFAVDMTDYQVQNRSYRMMVSYVKLDHVVNNLRRGEVLQISRETNKIEIFPEVVNYTIQDPYVTYYLEGFDEEKTTILQSQLTSIVYTNLPTGKYTFHLSVLDSTTGRVLEESIYEVVKEKKIYDHRWFLAYMLFVFMLAIAWFTWFIVRTQIQRTINFQKKELEFVKQQVEMGNETILAIARTVDAKDVRTSEHSKRVSEYTVLIARELGFEEKECENIRKAALLHDIGKIGIADRVLNKPSKLTDEEYVVMKSHVTRGAEILKDFTLVDHVIDGALYHHERYDGKGYMKGLKGEEIPLYGRIIGVADAFDAMTVNRVYQKKRDGEEVIRELKRGSGTQFDPEIVTILLRLIREGSIDMNKLYNSLDELEERKG